MWESDVFSSLVASHSSEQAFGLWVHDRHEVFHNLKILNIKFIRALSNTRLLRHPNLASILRERFQKSFRLLTRWVGSEITSLPNVFFSNFRIVILTIVHRSRADPKELSVKNFTDSKSPFPPALNFLRWDSLFWHRSSASVKTEIIWKIFQEKNTVFVASRLKKSDDFFLYQKNFEEERFQRLCLSFEVNLVLFLLSSSIFLSCTWTSSSVRSLWLFLSVDIPKWLLTILKTTAFHINNFLRQYYVLSLSII